MILHSAAALTVLSLRARARLTPATGQGTVEYVGLILLIAGVLAAVVTFGKSFNGTEIGKAITGQLEKAIEGVGQ